MQNLAEREHLAPTQAGRKVCFEVLQELEPVEDGHPAQLRENDEFRSSVARISDFLHDAHLVELFHQLGDCLFADTDTLSEGGDPGSLEIDVGEKSRVRCAQGDTPLPALADSGESHLVGQPGSPKKSLQRGLFLGLPEAQFVAFSLHGMSQRRLTKLVNNG